MPSEINPSSILLDINLFNINNNYCFNISCI
jgi:hypothetical protein